jgi:hypothetical protein
MQCRYFVPLWDTALKFREVTQCQSEKNVDEKMCLRRILQSMRDEQCGVPSNFEQNRLSSLSLITMFFILSRSQFFYLSSFSTGVYHYTGFCRWKTIPHALERPRRH